MAIKLTTTNQATRHVKCLVYGESGIGKTTLCKTAPNPIIVSAEDGLLSLSDVQIPVIEVKTVDDLAEAITFINTSEDAKQFETVCIDSISDIAEALLIQYQKEEKDPRKAYGRVNNEVLDFARKFRDLPERHIYITAKAKRLVDDTSGLVTFIPMMPGQQLGPALPYLYDFVLPLRIGQFDNGEGGSVETRYIQTTEDIQWIAKDRSGKLDAIEEPDLGKLFAKALNPDIARK